MTEQYALVEGVKSEDGLLILADGSSLPDTLSTRRELNHRFASGYPLTEWAASDYDEKTLDED